MANWSPNSFVPFVVPIVFAVLRRYLPPPPSTWAKWSYAIRQKPEPLPVGVIGAMMWGFGIALSLTYFLLRWLNHLWASMDGPALLRLNASQAYWWFLSLFGAICIPWPLRLWLLRRMGRRDEADSIQERSSSQAGMDTYAVLTFMSWWFVLPIALASLLAVPIHMSITDKKVIVGHYGRLQPEVYPLSDARRAVLTDTRKIEHHSLATRSNLTLYFADGRHLDANAVADGRESANPEVVRLLLELTGLQPERVIADPAWR